jgi:prolyl 4-hydroxylase
MSFIGKLLGRSGGAAHQPVPEPASKEPPPTAPEAAPAEPTRPAKPAASPPLERTLAYALAAAAQSRQPEPSLPGSDRVRLAAIGAEVRSRLEADPSASKVEALNLDMFAVRGFLTPAECAELIALIDADVKPSTILKDGIDPTFRTSETCKLPATHPIVAEVERRMSELLGIPISHSETVQGQRYRAGQQFKVHNDYFAANQPYSEAAAEEGGQRTWTAMVFLNKPEAGGQTHFPKAMVKVSPRPGALLTWNNVDREGHPNRFSHHEGMQVRDGVKYILTKWFREREWQGSAKSDALRR